jgi:hypothetical protein
MITYFIDETGDINDEITDAFGNVLQLIQVIQFKDS